MRGVFAYLIAAAVAAVAIFWVITAPKTEPPEGLRALTGDAVAGEKVFWASGCASCHATPDGDDPLVLAGGVRLDSDFGTFITPNISTDPTHGIGGWTLEQFAVALIKGVSPDGQHYYPAFPYGSYANMRLQDIADLKAFMDTLPADPTPSPAHALGFPYNIRAAVGAWKQVGLLDGWVQPAPSPELERGRYLVEALAHCGECHTPRNPIGVLDRSRWMAGAPNPSGRGRIPGLTPAQLDWSAEDLVYYLETGFTPDFDSVGGSMASVVRNMSKLTVEDREAIAAYVLALPDVE